MRIDLRKVLGTENPSDILTKHLGSQDKMMQLVKLFGCKYLQGRAATAPKLRQGESNKTTMKELEQGIMATEEVEVESSHSDFVAGRMPHLEYPPGELDTRFPRILAVPDDGLDPDPP